ncbi:hypothetical protein DICVIV_12719 [Dictyocaulus viviparus]|uniref:Uncharacterized protein n=1 Tax=Dictyocaulus viviparus TaxID=29172 RepID=A0A0D8X9S1_DICVI|nr:hypothetical protein DICVIV_12719 [Dictyocaulus viviparus]
MLVIAAHSPHYKEPCPVIDHSANKNGPRTPSPDIMRKPDYNAEIERLKKDIEEEKRRADLQTKLDLLELKFQAKLREKAANDSAPKDKEGEPRTPSPDIMRKPDYNAEIERLKKDIEEEKRRADLQTKLDLLELKFQAKLREKAANDSAPKDKEDAIPSQNAAKIDSSSGLEGPSQSCPNDSDAMDVDGGESEEERCDEAENDRIAGTDIQMTTESVPIDKSQGGFANAIKGQSDNVTGQPPQISPHFNFMRGLRGGPPRAGRFGFSNVPGPTVRSRSGFFPPRMRGVVRGAPNLRRGFPKTGGFPPPMTPQPFRGRGGGFYGGRRAGPRGGL